MSVGHISEKYQHKTPEDLRRILDEGDTRELLNRSHRLDKSHTIPYGGGISVDGKTVYIDAELYRDVMAGKVPVPGVTPKQLIEHWCRHEKTERAIIMGDNPADTYAAAHPLAETAEHEGIKNPETYENAQEAALRRTLQRPVTNPPKDLWAGPYVEDSDKRDKEILRQFRAKGVTDAFKLGKSEVHYGLGPEKCKDCAMFSQKERGPLRSCDDVSGLVRWDRWCERWIARK